MELKEQLRAAAPLISVGVMAADWMSLAADLGELKHAGVKLLHIDVMDGCFCPTLTVGAPVVARIKTPLWKDVHLMVNEPIEMVPAFVAAGADIVTIHAESTRHPHRVLQLLGELTNANDPSRGIVRGLALNPGTPVTAIVPLLDHIDLVLLLAVNPGWSGQKFIAGTRERLRQLRDLAGDDVIAAVDGGITKENFGEVAGMGADILVTGSAVFAGGAAGKDAQFMIDALGARP
jgi:ribulose-phosphate 3-epimerase